VNELAEREGAHRDEFKVPMWLHNKYLNSYLNRMTNDAGRTRTLYVVTL